jgi:ACT domain-containing protein
MANLVEQDIKKLTEEAIKQLGKKATPETVEKIVKEAIDRIGANVSPEVDVTPLKKEISRQTGNRIIVTAFGKNKVGILAGLTGVLAQYKCDILDLTQKLLQEFFTIMILVDISGSEHDFETLKSEITKTGEDLDLKVVIQHEEIFNIMHRV